MDDSKSEKRLKIIEWNINCCKTSSTSKKWKKFADCIITESPDILVLTECGTEFEAVNFHKMLGNLTETEWEIRYNNDRTHNYIAFLVNTRKKNSNIEVTISNNLFDDNHTRIHPDRVAVHIDITFKDDLDDFSKSIRVLGIRMRTSGLTLEQRIHQNIQLVHDIQALKPDIIIGDFNTCSEMERLNIYNATTWKRKKIIYEGKELKPEFCEWDKWLNKLVESNEPPTDVLDNFCKLISEKPDESYQYWPEKDKAYSFCSKRTKKDDNGQNITMYTSPDTIVWNSKKISLSKSSKDNKNPKYYPQIAQDQDQKPSDIVNGWPSDHCMLIADIEIN